MCCQLPGQPSRGNTFAPQFLAVVHIAATNIFVVTNAGRSWQWSPSPESAKPVKFVRAGPWLMQMPSVSYTAFPDVVRFLRLQIQVQSWPLIFLSFLKAGRSGKQKRFQMARGYPLLRELVQMTVFLESEVLISLRNTIVLNMSPTIPSSVPENQSC